MNFFTELGFEVVDFTVGQVIVVLFAACVAGLCSLAVTTLRNEIALAGVACVAFFAIGHLLLGLAESVINMVPREGALLATTYNIACIAFMAILAIRVTFRSVRKLIINR